jgi:squalene-hopene/tetraprenyl-beta-curcumene cyclase
MRTKLPAMLVLLSGAVPALAQPKLAASSLDEPVAEEVSLARSAEFLDAVAVKWTQQRKCGACHTNYAYMMSRPLLKDVPGEGLAQVRKFFEQRAANWDDPKGKARWDTEVVATAVALAINDDRTTGKLHDLTRKALDRMWTLQRADGAWDWLKCGWPPMEHDDYFGATYAVLGVGNAPDKYADTPAARKGLEKVRGYFKKNPAPDLHHQAMLLWASMKLDGLMDAKERDDTVKKLLALQRPDGGWTLPSLGDYPRHEKGEDGKPIMNDKNGPSDGYGTGFVIYVLRQAGVPAKHDQIRRGVAWLRANQRESGRWFTRSLNTDNYHFISHAGTAFAVMALRACEEP